MILPMMQKTQQEGALCVCVPRLANTELVPNDVEVISQNPKVDKMQQGASNTAKLPKPDSSFAQKLDLNFPLVWKTLNSCELSTDSNNILPSSWRKITADQNKVHHENGLSFVFHMALTLILPKLNLA